jgi:hypothetical protein
MRLGPTRHIEKARWFDVGLKDTALQMAKNKELTIWYWESTRQIGTAYGYKGYYIGSKLPKELQKKNVTVKQLENL